MYYKVNGTVVLCIKQESLEIIELKDECLNMRGGTPLPHWAESQLYHRGDIHWENTPQYLRGVNSALKSIRETYCITCAKLSVLPLSSIAYTHQCASCPKLFDYPHFFEKIAVCAIKRFKSKDSNATCTRYQFENTVDF